MSALPAAKPARRLLEVEDLGVSLGSLTVVDGVSFHVDEGETLGLVGESGCGKTTTGLALLGLLQKSARPRVTGRALFDGRDLVSMSERERRAHRGRDISMILQDPMASLNPVLDIGFQVGEAAEPKADRRLRDRVTEALRLVRIPAAETRLRDFPHQLSGGMKQRVAGAIAMIRQPRLLIADEPTTSLDVTIQAQYLTLLKDLQRRFGMAMIFITHDFGVVARMCDRVCVMYAGRIVETGPVRDIFRRPAHWYTAALVGGVPKLTARMERLVSIPGAPPRPGAMPAGCRFAPRCANDQARCREADPTEQELGGQRSVSCWFPKATP